MVGHDIVVEQHDDAIGVGARTRTDLPAARASMLYLLRSWLIKQVVVCDLTAAEKLAALSR